MTTTDINKEEPIAETHKTEKVIELCDVYKSFGNNHVLNGLNLTVYRGDAVVVVGKSGSGKSVTIKCIVGLVKPDKGEVKVLGRDIWTLDEKELAELRMKIGFLFQNNALYDSLTVKENLSFPLRRHKKDLTEEQLEARVREALADVKLEYTIDMMPSELSGGMKKRIALARTLIVRPQIMLYDEPTTGLDPITAKGIIELIGNIQDKYKTTSIIITHDMNCLKYFNKDIVMLIDGICYARGTFEEHAHSSDSKIRNFYE